MFSQIAPKPKPKPEPGREFLDTFLASLEPEQIGEDRFRSWAVAANGTRVFGGDIIAHALCAARKTVAFERVAHSLHLYFLSAGDINQPLDIAVERLRDGRSFCSRQVRIEQSEKLIASAMVSFQTPEKGLEYSADMPSVPGPENLTPDHELLAEYIHESWRSPFEMRQVSPIDINNPQPLAPRSYTWFKATGDVPADPTLHQYLLANASDHCILMTAMRPHGLSPFSSKLREASLDHALWFHKPVEFDGWLLFECDSDVTGGGRATGRGRIFNARGEIVASVMQEGLMRLLP